MSGRVSALGAFLGNRPPRPNPRGPALDAGVAALVLLAARGEGRPARPRLLAALGAVLGGDPPRLPPVSRLVFGERDLFAKPLGADPSAPPARWPLAFPDPRAAWEALEARGVIPTGWVGDPARRFVSASGGQFSYLAPRHPGDEAEGWVVRGTSSSSTADASRFAEPPEPLDLVVYDTDAGRSRWGVYRRGFSEAPTSVELAVALAADAPNLPQAEALVQEFLARLAPWGSAEERARPVRWGWQRTGVDSDRDRPVFPPSSLRTGALRSATESASRVLDRAPALRAKVDRLLAGVGGPLAVLGGAAFGWAEAVRTGAPAEWGTWAGPPATLLGTPFAALPDPFEPLLHLWAMGYGVFDTEGPNLRVAVPPLRAPV